MTRPNGLESIYNVRAGETADGWERIGTVDAAKRRSIWIKLIGHEDRLSDDAIDVDRIELRGGREGDDFYAAIDKTNPQFEAILGFLLCGRFAVQLEAPDGPK